MEVNNFISEFISRQFLPSAPAAGAAAHAAAGPSDTTPPPPPRTKKGGKKVKKSLNSYAQPPRLANDGQEALFANPQGVYIKKEMDLHDEYYSGAPRKAVPNKPGKQPEPPSSSSSSSPSSTKAPPPPVLSSTSSYAAISKPLGKLTSDSLAPPWSSSSPSSSSSSKKPAPQKQSAKQEKYVYATMGGTAMRGATTELADLEAALRALEISTNPTLTSSRRPCACQGLIHEVLQAAPNCLSCGKIVCIQEGLGPCTFCGAPLLAAGDVQDMVRALRDAAGSEKMAINAAQNRRAEVAKTPRPFASGATGSGGASGGAGAGTGASDGGDGSGDEGLRKAQEHRDRLLGYQATSAQRTRVIDQAAEFETPLAAGGLNQWATPSERALQLKSQQKAMRLIEWHAKPAYEKRKMVVAIDLKGRQVVKQMRDIEAPDEGEDEDEDGDGGAVAGRDDSLARGGKGKATEPAGGSGTYSRNPLLKGLIKPVYTPAANGKAGTAAGVDGYANRNFRWRRVQDNLDDNEQVVLDGRLQGRDRREERSDEIPCG